MRRQGPKPTRPTAPARRAAPLLAAAALLAAAGPAAAGAATDVAPTPTLELRLAPIDERERQRMLRWHGVYRRLMAPVLRRWSVIERGSLPRPSRRLISGCRGLARSLAELDRRPLAAAPDRAAALHLDRALRALDRATRSCAHGAYFLADRQLDEAAAALAQLRGRLALYGLEP